MKKIIFILIIASIILIISACDGVNKEMPILGNISSISISKSQGYGGLNNNLSAVYREKEALSDFEEVMKNAKGKRVDFIDNINEEKPDYDILVEYENGGNHLLHLILGQEEQESILMYVGYEYNPYYVTPVETKRLRGLIKEH